jgi:menaquinone-dependent protoporphyrinogen oxidase
LAHISNIHHKEKEMKDTVLIAQASKHGATIEIAEKIGETLAAAGIPIEVVPVKKVKDLSSYRAAIVGSAVYVGAWRKDFVKFLTANQNSLADMPVWLFSSGPSGEGDPVELLEGWRFPEAHQPLLDAIQPREIVVFHGALFPDRLNLIEKKMIEMVKAPVGDFRDWDAIAAWAAKIAAELNAG